MSPIVLGVMGTTEWALILFILLLLGGAVGVLLLATRSRSPGGDELAELRREVARTNERLTEIERLLREQ